MDATPGYLSGQPEPPISPRRLATDQVPIFGGAVPPPHSNKTLRAQLVGFIWSGNGLWPWNGISFVTSRGLTLSKALGRMLTLSLPLAAPRREVVSHS